MARFGVYRNPSGRGYLLDVQADLMSHFNTRVVIPLLPLDLAPKPASTLNPVFEIEGLAHALVTQYMAAVPVALLRQPVESLGEHRSEVVAAIDLLLQGF
ncbi:CcdB family protein [Pseudazoarcus pumilus]|uniref:Toxin CcdB n=1 Tax=Pseudazoarcus pumilus TaxID=2067960 RepID=A0A2I6SAB4_9RHOO|nr:CcdB family protein [Pseudazoarcus pumilus]AUN96208.1 plasmid maintenance protein CcdB [Pseudazoarcus pumilus]